MIRRRTYEIILTDNSLNQKVRCNDACGRTSIVVDAYKISTRLISLAQIKLPSTEGSVKDVPESEWETRLTSFILQCYGGLFCRVRQWRSLTLVDS